MPVGTKKNKTMIKDTQHKGDDLNLAKESLTQMLHDKRLPASVRGALKSEYAKLGEMLTRLENQHLHIVVFGRVSVGKSSLLNALIGDDLFSVSVLHGETTQTRQAEWETRKADGVFLIDTPGINEAYGEAREQIALDAAQNADLVLFVVDSDITETEMMALKALIATARPMVLVINKADQYSQAQQAVLKKSIINKVTGLIDPKNILFAASSPPDQTVLHLDAHGNEVQSQRSRPVDIGALQARLWEIIETEGKTLSALNASLFAGNLSTQLGQKIIEAREALGRETIRLYCMSKGVAVALNPLPVADLLAAAAIDVGMVYHLSRIYGLPMTKSESGALIKSIASQMLALYGTFWAIHLASSALKISTAGVSTVVTGIAQGGVAWYSTLVVGEAAEAYLAKGKSWGTAGPKLVVKNILADLDKDSVIQNAKTEIRRVLKSTAQTD
jgi:small GTP-binding protein